MNFFQTILAWFHPSAGVSVDSSGGFNWLAGLSAGWKTYTAPPPASVPQNVAGAAPPVEQGNSSGAGLKVVLDAIIAGGNSK